MTIQKIRSITQKLPTGITDTLTPVGIYLRLRDQFAQSMLLESSDYHGHKDSKSFICFDVAGRFQVTQGRVLLEYPDGRPQEQVPAVGAEQGLNIPQALSNYLNDYEVIEEGPRLGNHGLFGYCSYDAVQYFENIPLVAERKACHEIPEINYIFYRHIITFDHFHNRIYLTSNLQEGEQSEVASLLSLLIDQRVSRYTFTIDGAESSNLSDEDFMQLVDQGKKHCALGDVFQIVLSRQFSQSFKGDEFNVYRALRNVNPSPYLFYFDFGNFKLFGSSPEAQIIVDKRQAFINPIAGTFKRTGNDEDDLLLAEKLSKDAKENAEHVMLVDLARNDLSKNSRRVSVMKYKEVQFYSHVLHLVSEVRGELSEETKPIDVLANTFPAGTLSGSPKFRAMQLIDQIENQARGYYGGAIGFLSFSGNINHAIMIRSFLSKGNKLYSQAGAGIVIKSEREKELEEINNKLGALKQALILAQDI